VIVFTSIFGRDWYSVTNGIIVVKIVTMVIVLDVFLSASKCS
jgi:hypothetical protein